jgi:glucokinase
MNILFDIGATNTRIALANSVDSFETPIVYSTPDAYEDGIRILTENILKLSKGNNIDAIAGCIAGPWDDTNGMITESGNLSGWHNKPLKNDLKELFNTRILIDNDAAMAGLGEAVYGAGKGFYKVLYMTVSTGVGGAVITDGRVAERLEPRNEVVNENGDTLGRLISGKAVESKMGKKPEDIVDPIIWEDLSKILSKGLSNLITKWSPDVVVVGGSMVKEVGISVIATEKYLHELMDNKTPLVKAKLGDFGGLYGALVILKTEKSIPYEINS